VKPTDGPGSGELGSPRVERVFGVLQRLVDRVVKNSWQDRVVGKLARDDKTDDEDAKPDDAID